MSARGASFALAAFWAKVTTGRLLIAVISRRVSRALDLFGFPILLLVIFQLASRVQDEAKGIIVFGLAGLGCSAFLPLSISFGGSELPSLAAVMAGGADRILSAGVWRGCIWNGSIAGSDRAKALYSLRRRQHRGRSLGRDRLLRHRTAAGCRESVAGPQLNIGGIA